MDGGTSVELHAHPNNMHVIFTPQVSVTDIQLNHVEEMMQIGGQIIAFAAAN